MPRFFVRLLPFLVLLAPAAAHAEKEIVVESGTTYTYENDHLVPRVLVKKGGVIKIKSVDTGGSGKVHFKANSIVVEDGGIIDATGAGYAGVDGKAGQGPGGGGAVDTKSGGGGGYFGNGGAGFDASLACKMYGTGGAAYGTLGMVDIGSAGGAGSVTVGAVGSRGGRGGGSITLEAAEIQIDGVVRADGEGSLVAQNVGRGGGAGGEVRIIAPSFKAGTTSMISAVGGQGGKGSTLHGGSGGGGLVLLQGPKPADLNYAVNGGAEAVACNGVGAGGMGKFQEGAQPPPCPDLDGDGFKSALCDMASNDCDDSDATIHPGADEICDGVDNDCSGTADDHLNPGDQGDCSKEQICSNGMCIAKPVEDAGADGAPDAAPSIERITYEGGCSVGRAGDRRGLALLALGLVALARRRARRVG